MAIKLSKPIFARSSICRSVRAFTLVELLVVVGIVTLLIALLLPSLTLAREAGLRTVCAAKLQQIMMAAQVHSMDHKGYYPVAGYVGNTDPEHDTDNYATHYDYFSYTAIGAPRLLVPITMALATEMSFGYVLSATDDSTEGAYEINNKGFIKHFLCPSQASSVDGLNFGNALPMLYMGQYPGWTIWYTQGQSYIYNEAVVGIDPALNRLAGKASRVRRASATLFAADGLGGSIYNPNRVSSYHLRPNGLPMFTVYNNVPNGPVTLADALLANTAGNTMIAGDPQNFDRFRHRGKMNIAFCDGHVETRNISAQDLANVYISAP